MMQKTKGTHKALGRARVIEVTVKPIRKTGQAKVSK
jgi:hypothetical protein